MRLKAPSKSRPVSPRVTLEIEIRRAIRRALADQVARLRGGCFEETCSAFVAMFRSALETLCNFVAYSDDPEYRLSARSALPGIAGALLFEELLRSGEVQQGDLRLLHETLDIAGANRGFTSCGIPQDGTAPVKRVAKIQPLGVPLAFDIAAAEALLRWAADPPAEAGVPLGMLELLFGPGDFKTEFAEFRKRQKQQGRPVSVEAFCKRAGLSTARFYVRLKANSLKNDDEAQRIRALMYQPATDWPEAAI